MRTNPVRSVRLVITTSVVAAACLVGSGAVLLGVDHPAAAGSERASRGETGQSQVSEKVERERIREASGVRDQVVSGRFGAAASAAPAESGSVVTYAYAGDSITARPNSWLHVLASNRNLEAVGGYAHSGYRSDQVLAAIGPVSADVLVIELGTNDINQDVPFTRIVSNINRVAAKVGAEHVLLVAAPPSDKDNSLWGVNRRVGSAKLNVLLAADAERHGWLYHDPFAAFRESNNSYKPGSTSDGIHPTGAANRVIAKRFAVEIKQAARAASS
jgi:lysophospholipase L1-like esterase